MNTNTAKKASQEDWHPAEIICALRKKGWTLKALALHHGLKDSSSMSAALVRSLPANEKRIADAIEVHPKTIWPSRYHANGERRLMGFHALRSNADIVPRRTAAGNVNVAQAA